MGTWPLRASTTVTIGQKGPDGLQRAQWHRLYWPTIHKSISKIYSEFQVLRSYISEVDELLEKKIQLRSDRFISNDPIPMWQDGLTTRLQSRILVYVVWPWCSPQEIRQWQLCTQNFDSSLQNMTSHIPFVFDRSIIDTHLCLVIKASHSESGDMDPIQAGWWNSLLSLGHFAWHWAKNFWDISLEALQSLS